MSIDVHRFWGKYSLLIMTTTGMQGNLKNAIDALQEIVEKMWISIPIPVNNIEPIRNVSELANLQECDVLLDAIERNRTIIDFDSGAIIRSIGECS